MVGLAWLRRAATLSLVGDHFAILAPGVLRLTVPALVVLVLPVREATVLPALEFRVLSFPNPPVLRVVQEAM